jgi:hypothetical protein
MRLAQKITPEHILPPWRLCRNEENTMFVILNEVKNLIISTESIIEILRLSPQNDIVTQSLKGEGSYCYFHGSWVINLSCKITCFLQH